MPKKMTFGFFTIIIFSFIACASTPIEDATIQSIEGIWISPEGLEYVFSNGSFKLAFEDQIFQTGTYFINGRQIITQINYSFGAGEFAYFTLEPDLYSREILYAVLKEQLVDDYLSIEQFNDAFERDFGRTYDETVNFFSVRGDTLLLDWYNWPILLTKKY